MRVLIFGAGAVGSLFGGMLSQKYDVTLLGRKKHMDTVKKNGLKISGKTNITVHPRTAMNVEGTYDLIILTVKSYDTEKSIETLKPILDKNTVILSLQNGLGNEEIIVNSLKNRVFSIRYDGKVQSTFPSILGKADSLSRGNKGVLRGITNHGVIFVKPGEIHHSGIGETVIGEIDGMITDRIKKICSMFNDAGIKTMVSKDIKKEVWAKTIINSAINPVTAITGLKNGYLLKIPRLTKLMEQVCLEGVKVANASGVFFDYDVFEKTKKIAEFTANNKSSMLQDIESRKRTEIDFINGAIVKIGKKRGLETPVNSMLTVLVKGIESRLSAD
jgi:2-dehydropantoate 2-reductase